MKIDLHCHTKKIKNGEPETRQIISVESFKKSITECEVKFVAITNHNHFDLKQFKLLKDDNYILLPGIELDIKQTNSKNNAHIIIVGHQNLEDEFSSFVKSLNISDVNLFSLSIDELVTKTKNLNCLIIAHYRKGENSITENDLNELTSKLEKNDKQIFLEPSNLRTAGIMIANNMNTFIGSDIRDWNMYSKKEMTNKLPDLKINFETFEKLMLFLKKDKNAIDGFLQDKLLCEEIINSENIKKLKIPLYKDLNLICGEKASGKSEILKFIENDLKNKDGNNVCSFYIENKNDDFNKLIKYVPTTEIINKLDLDVVNSKFNEILEFKKTTPTNIKEYIEYYKNMLSTGKIFAFSNATYSIMPDDNALNSLITDYPCFLEKSTCVDSTLDKYKLNDDRFKLALQRKHMNLKTYAQNKFSEYHSIILTKFTLETMKLLRKQFTGLDALPVSTGFTEFFHAKLKFKTDIKAILEKINSSKVVDEFNNNIGFLEDKGRICLRKIITLNSEDIPKDETNDWKYLNEKINKTNLTMFKKNLEKLLENDDKQNDFSTFCNEKNIKKLNDVISFCSIPIDENGKKYIPSNGEQSIIILQRILNDDSKNIYILDEPDNGLDALYKDEIILPRIIELWKMGRTVILSTHDSNLATRSLPIQTIYRNKKNGIYKTYIGSMFSNVLKEPGSNDSKQWNIITMNLVEGGEKALSEREKIYGI
ncbi:MAG: hypothetical protein Ta2E_06650 [Mycoplasmoidaceae bacterium]|nr:MAG: hypothetical protein Ta2E_06650 [Mycoplasmoidaceae bacterium]